MEILTHATIWLKLEDMMLGETSQAQKNKLFDSTYMGY